MYSPSENLTLLKHELGDQARLLHFAPANRVHTANLGADEDPSAVSFKILVGGMKATATHDNASPSLSRSTYNSEQRPSHAEARFPQPIGRQKVWAHLYPALKPGQRLEIQFHAYGLDGVYTYKHDGETICKSLSGSAAAFKLPAECRWSKTKLIALTKYYFLQKLVEVGTGADTKKMRFGMSVRKTLMEDLKTVCREFEEASRSM